MTAKLSHLLKEKKRRRMLFLRLKKDRLFSFQCLFFAKEKTLIRRFTNFCIISGASKAIYRHVRLSRHMFKRYASNGDINGVRRSSW
jgi:ribosomal protein S14